MKAKTQNLNFLQFQWDFLAAVALALSWLGVYFPLRMHAAAEKSDPYSLDIRGMCNLSKAAFMARCVCLTYSMLCSKEGKHK